MTMMEHAQSEGVKDLPLAVRAKFAKALLAEEVAGHTTPEALAFLDEAIEYEEKWIAEQNRTGVSTR